MGAQTILLNLERAGRLDKVLAEALACDEAAQALGFSRARVQQLLKEGLVSLSGSVITDANHKLKGESVACSVIVPPPVAAEPQAEVIPLSIVFEDEDMLVIDKPAGLVVHPAAGNWEGTLVNALLAHCGASLSGIGGVARPGIVHRLDKDTSGLMVVAKNDFAHQKLTAQFADRSLSRVYQALVWGVPSPISGEIKGAIGRHPRSRQKMAVVEHGGKDALTYYGVTEAFGTLASLVECKLATGRTHQIRVHMAHVGHPVVGDPLYGSQRGKGGAARKDETGIVGLLGDFERQALHAGAIRFIHPRSSKALNFKAPLPEDMADLLKKLRKKGVA